MKSFLNFKSIDEQINEVLSKDATAGDWISDFIKSDNPKFAGKSASKRKEMALAAYYAAQKNEAVIQPNGTDKIQPDEGMCEGLCQVCGATDCKEHFYKSPAVTGYVKESTPYYNKPSFLKKMGRVAKQERLAREKKEAEQKQVKEATVDTADIEKNKLISNKDKNTLSKLSALMAKEKKPIKEESGEHHDYAHVKKTMKKVDYDTYTKHMNKNDADHSMENKHKVDTQHSGSYTGKIHGAEVSHKVSGSGQKEYYIKEETLDEISKETLGNYVHKSFARGNEIHKQLDKQVDDVQSPEERAKLKAELSKRNSGVIKAAQKMRNEDLEEQAPVAGSLTRHTVVVHVSDPDEPKQPKQRKAVSVLALHAKSAEASARKHYEKKGYKVHSTEVKKPVSEDVDMGQADRTLRSKDKSGSTYHVKDSSGKIISTHDNHSDAMRGALKHDDHKVVKEAIDTVKKDESGKVIAWSHEGDWEKNSTKKQGTGKAANLAGQALQKTKSLNKEEIELEESWEVYDTKTRAIHSSHPTQRKALNAMNKLNDKHPGYETPGNLIASKFGARVSKAVKEEVQIDEAVWGKDKATNLRQAHDRHMEKALAANKAGDDEAVKTHQRKMQMIQGKLQKLKNNEEVELGEECEILSELDKKTLGNYVKKAHDQLMKHTSSVNFKQGRGDSDAFAYAHDKESVRKTANRTKGVDQAINKLTKEDTMVTYKEFMASIEEGRIDDLRDKLAADREKRLNKMDYSKEKEAAKNPVTKVKGHSYGAGDEEGEAETKKAAEPAEKRGRGRPAGSKSGATKYN